jgi:hypothetical protein
MRESCAVQFSEYPVFDWFAVYFRWLTDTVKRDCDYGILAETITAVRNENSIPNIDSINTTLCNLNCKHCSNGIQYRTEKKFLSIERQISALEKLTGIMPISVCNLQGGEPLLAKNFPDLLRRHAQNPKIAVLTIATNGAILPRKEIMSAVLETGAMFRISDYGELSKKKTEIFESAEAIGIPCELYPRAESWVIYGDITPRKRDVSQNRSIAASCFFGTKDLMLYDGKLFCCCRTLFAEALGLDAPAVRANTLDLDGGFGKTELDRIVGGEDLWQICDYCDWPMKTVPPAEQLEKTK